MRRKLADKIFSIVCLLLSLVPISFLFAMLFSIFSDVYYGVQQTKMLINASDFGLVKSDSRYQIKTKLIQHIHSKTKSNLHLVDTGVVMKFLSDYAVHEVVDNLKKGKKEFWITISGEADCLHKHNRHIDSPLSNLVEHFNEAGKLKKFFNYKLFINSDSRDNTQAGIVGALVGSLYTAFIALVVSLPIGILTALCIEEFMQQSRFVHFFEVSINNLSSTPPIIFGILGLSFYINFLGLPRSSSLTGGLTLAFMMFPILVISIRQAISSVPVSIKQAAYALGASKMEVITHHVLPLSFPGIITGTILSIARILGESAPLLMIGMVAFIGDIPRNFSEPATVFAVQTYIWAISPDKAFVEKTSVVILVLLVILLTLNCIAYFLKKSFHVEFH